MKRTTKLTCGLLFTALVALLTTPLLLSGIGGCGGGGSTCDVVTNSGCNGGDVCEEVTDGTVGCFAPLQVRGNVSNLADATPIEGARVVALDANGSPASSVATTDSSGNYQVTVATKRNSDGTPVSGSSITLRADASGFQTFPEGVRQALPIDISSPTQESALVFVVQSALTNIGLNQLESGAGTATIHGTVELPSNSRGALVVAESSPTTGFSAIADRNGDYKIFNLPAGDYSVKGFVLGANYDPGSVTLTAGQDAEVNLSLNSNAPGTVTGSVQIVNAPGGSLTSVILVVESTFDETLARGENPPGLRAPAPGTAPNVSGSYTIDGVPDGNYVVLAAFENDGLVRDPDLSIGGTSILHISVTSGNTTTVDGFKVTEALEVFSPGANGPETVVGNPTFSWKDDSSEDNYDVVVFDTFGNIICSFSEPKHTGSNPSVLYSDKCSTPLESGLFYQFRATSTKSGVPISRTEDLKGVFLEQ